jgi:hypothetical protein
VGDELLAVEGTIAVVDRYPLLTPVLAVDAADFAIDLALHGPILLDLVPARDDDLDQDDATDQLGMGREEALEEGHPFLDALRVVQSIGAEQDPAAGVSPPQLLGARHDARQPGDALETVDVDPDRDRLRAGFTSRVPEGRGAARGIDLRVDERARAGDEVVPVQPDVEGDGIGGQQAAEDLLAPWQRAEDLRWRERDVQEEVDPAAKAELPQQAGDQHQVVVVDPDAGAFAGDREHDFGESSVDARVGPKVLGCEHGLPGKVVEQRPQGAIGEAVVVERYFPFAQGHAAQVDSGRGPEVDRADAPLLDRRRGGKRGSVPPDPGSFTSDQDRLEGIDQTAHVPLGRAALRFSRQIVREPIGDHHERGSWVRGGFEGHSSPPNAAVASSPRGRRKMGIADRTSRARRRVRDAPRVVG